eukprot:TRINITY_DN190_c0_g1_i3.p1 TRINITY_DN190_c0_g1~~TRINITY_DN190_c0_g1_i3.p1  ORF type:complete len:433 (-),score=120.91 TRINITY_DN190_c0_g1_i3:2211-3509(-)
MLPTSGAVVLLAVVAFVSGALAVTPAVIGQCLYRDSLDRVYDVTSLRNPTADYNVSVLLSGGGTISLKLNLCGRLIVDCGTKLTAEVCEVRFDPSPRNWGDNTSLAVYDLPSGFYNTSLGVTLVFSNGTVADGCAGRATGVVLVCDQAAGVGTPVGMPQSGPLQNAVKTYYGSACAVTMQWRTSVVCGLATTGTPPTTAVGSTGVASTGVATTDVASTGVATTAVGSTGVASTAVGSTGVASTAVGSTGVASTAVGSTGVASTAVGTTAVGSTAVGTTEVASTAVGSTGVASTAVGSTGVASTAAGTTEVASTAVGSTGVPTTAVASTGVASTAVGSTGVASTAVGSTGVASTAVASTAVGTTGVATTAAPAGTTMAAVAATTGPYLFPTCRVSCSLLLAVVVVVMCFLCCCWLWWSWSCASSAAGAVVDDM